MCALKTCSAACRRGKQSSGDIFLRDGIEFFRINDAARSGGRIRLKKWIGLQECRYLWIGVWASSGDPSLGKIARQLGWGVYRKVSTGLLRA